MDARWPKLEEQARAVEGTIASKSSNNAALEATIKSAELYLQALRLTDKPTDRKRLDVKCKELLAQAEKLKNKEDAPNRSAATKHQGGSLSHPVSTRKPTTRESIILLEGSKLNGSIFKPWTSVPSAEDFALEPGGQLFTDSTFLALSSTQLATFDGWKRSQDALAAIQHQANGQPTQIESTMHIPDSMDLVQDLTSDCSVVASLCAGTSRAERGHPKILRSIVHPYDHENDRISFSPSGKYVLKMYFDGCWRRVEIDDYLPTSKTSRVLHVIDRRHPGLLWPALVEKAYLKVRGGYDFPGSNSGTDLAVLTGWIPQQVFLHDEDVDQNALWDEVISNFRQGNVLITIGTGKLPRREQRQLGLASEHDYAVLELSSEGNRREVLVKNPWADGDVWRGAARRKPNLHDGEELDGDSSDNKMMPGTFWIDFNHMFQYFENMYINWNPGLFSHRQDMHFSWQQPQTGPAGNVLVENPQFAIQTSEAGEIWLLLNRHFRTGDYTQLTVGKNGHISIYLYQRNGHSVIVSDGAKARGPFVDSPNTLLRFQAAAQTAYTVVVVSQDLPPGKMNFTISAFSKSSIMLSEARLQYSQKHTVRSEWSRSNAGGNSVSATYLGNPQFRLRLGSKQKLALILRVGEKVKDSSPDIHVKILIVYSDGSRINRLRPRDVLAHSGDYRRGTAVIETELGAGSYTLICSTYDRDQYADFTLDLYSSSNGSPAPLVQLPADGSGRLSIRSTPAIFDGTTNRLLAPLSVPRMTRATIVARYNGVAKGQGSLFKMTLEQGQGPYKRVMASSEFDDEEFTSVASGLRIGDLDLQPSMCGPGTEGLWLVLERLARGHNSQASTSDEVLGVEVYTEERVELGPWGLGEG
ncbi:cysteine protease [Elasticomyces elasticus]|uniref:Cysteine protease n=1 Tax=Exophiala sideris TaxID=1016849 RepID=A0ABR0JLX9_9EURO|nr:cysteine protease [Elasticomyces elasticus]KAK5036584.1 cysteine protease [Exophiala sideris]KAK5041585.1 cysteine protease [Exophiala sideris]KAK5066967.1 cysteine protease [Exophiala sideris]KAK5185026.1 cysteine protease [Eurotiomycetes sp. CCFEE 6388]